MNTGSIAIRYSKALFEEARIRGIDKDVYDFLNILQYNMKNVPDLQRVLINPRIPKKKKFMLLATSSGLTDTISQSDRERYRLYYRFLQLVLEHQRENLLRTMILIYYVIYREYHHIVHVVFETAMTADAPLLQKVKEKIYAKTGQHVELESHVRPELIGGFCIRVGDRLYDFSYRTKLQNIRKRLWNK
jgi:F-type H+-transporting ATPase subunit delta